MTIPVADLRADLQPLGALQFLLPPQFGEKFRLIDPRCSDDAFYDIYYPSDGGHIHRRVKQTAATLRLNLTQVVSTGR